MTTFVLLTDNDSGTALVACEDMAEAQRVAGAGVFADGDVSAWLVPNRALTDTDEITDRLRDSKGIEELEDLEETDVPVVHVVLDADVRKGIIDLRANNVRWAEGDSNDEEIEGLRDGVEFLLGLLGEHLGAEL